MLPNYVFNANKILIIIYVVFYALYIHMHYEMYILD